MASAGGLITSGGGFANLTSGGGATPAWQLPAVLRYIRAHSHLPSWPMQERVNPGFSYLVSCPNSTNTGKSADRGRTSHPGSRSKKLSQTQDLSSCTYGRGYPDLSLLAAQTIIIQSGIPYKTGGLFYVIYFYLLAFTIALLCQACFYYHVKLVVTRMDDFFQ